MLATLTFLGSVLSAPATASSASCNDCSVLWIVVDTTRADHLGCFGGDKRNSPAADKLCAQGTSYAKHYAQAPYTMLSVASYLTGRYRLNTGIEFDSWGQGFDFHPLADEVTTLAEVLDSKGFAVEGVTANQMISDRKHMTNQHSDFDLKYYQGFDAWDYKDDDQIAAEAPATLERLAKGDSRFLYYVHAMGPHYPNERREGMEERRGGTWPEDLADFTPRELKFAAVNKGEVVLTEQHQEYLKELYADDIWWADQNIVGPLLDKASELGLNDKLLIVYGSDHGEALGELHIRKGKPEPYWGHSNRALVDPTLHVPLILAGPGIPAGTQVTDQITENVDLAPTILDYLGLPIDAAWGWDGHPIVGPNAQKGEFAIADSGTNANGKASGRSAAIGQTYTVSYRSANGIYVYYDHSVGVPRKQMKSPILPHAPLKKALENYYATQHAPGEAGTMTAPEGELLEALQELGYMGD